MDENGRPDEMPQTIGRYQIHGSVGYGAMGAVYKAFDPLIKRTLAIKTIRLDIPRQSPQYKSFIDRFYHEARISGTLSHPNIVTLFDIGEENGLPYLAMEFVEGETISSIVEKGKRFKPEKVINLVSQVASAIDYAHSKGVIHRDIKPSNLILYENEKVKVTDFGIAKLVDAELTQAGTLLGTPSYMSPEQAMGDKLDGRSDIFSLGVCAFEMLSGEQPFPGNNVTSILYKLVHVEPIEPTNLEMHGLVPQKWHDVFGKVLAKKPDDRYQTATEFVQDLEYCLGAWFGSVPDTTLVETPVPENATASTAATAKLKARPAPAPAHEEQTAAIPSRAKAATQAVKPPAYPEGDEIEMTVSMATPDLEEAATHVARPGRDTLVEPPATAVGDTTSFLSPQGAEAIEGTVVMQSPVTAPRPATPPPAAEFEGTVVLPGPPDAPEQPQMEGTLLLPSPVIPAAPGQSEGEGTLLMATSPLPATPSAPPPQAPAAEGTLLMASPVIPPHAPAPAHHEVEGTVMMAVPPMPPARPTTPPQSEVEGTLLMASPSLAAMASAPPVVAPRPAPAAEGQAPPKKGLPIVPIAAAGGVALLVVIGVLGARFMKRGEQVTPTPVPPTPVVSMATPTPTPPPAVAVLGSLRVESQPTGATVTLDGEAKGTTPVAISDLPMGEHEVKVELKGYAASVEKVALAAEAPSAELKLTLSKTAPPVGSAAIRSVPPGALVRVDGIAVGQTPIKEQKMKVGKHAIDVSADGYETWSGTVTIKEGRRASVDAQLKAIPKATPTPEVKVDVVDPNKVYAPNEVDTPPKKLSGASAAYPKNAPGLKSGEAVSVAVEFVVAANGEVTDIRVAQSGGQAVDEAVAAAVSKWKYAPGVKKGTKVKVRVTFRQTFKAG